MKISISRPPATSSTNQSFNSGNVELTLSDKPTGLSGRLKIDAGYDSEGYLPREDLLEYFFGELRYSGDANKVAVQIRNSLKRAVVAQKKAVGLLHADFVREIPNMQKVLKEALEWVINGSDA